MFNTSEAAPSAAESAPRAPATSRMQLADALIYGNTVVWKPADLTPLTAYHLAGALVDAGLPDGVLTLVFGRGSVLGRPLVEDSRSRYCARCGAPGSRVKQIQKEEVEAAWPSRYLEEHGWTATAGNFVPLAGGELFWCANPGCVGHNGPVNAHLNASSNLLHWFFSGQVELRLVVRSNGLEAVSLAHGGPWKGVKLARRGDGVWAPPETRSHPSQGAAAAGDLPDEEAAASGTVLLYRDPSGTTFDPNTWVEGHHFWRQVVNRIWSRVRGGQSLGRKY